MFAPPRPTSPSLTCTAHISALRAPPVYCKPLQSLWLAWIVQNTSATLIADDVLPPSLSQLN